MAFGLSSFFVPYNNLPYFQILESLSIFWPAVDPALLLHKNEAMEKRITICFDGRRVSGIREEDLPVICSAVCCIYYELQKNCRNLEEICVSGVLTQERGGLFFRAFDIFLIAGRNSRYVTVGRAQRLFSAFGVPHFVKSP